MKIKVFSEKFMDAQYSFGMLKFYYEHMTVMLRRSADDFHKYTDELEIKYKRVQKKFDKQEWLKHYDVYEEIYPGSFHKSFLISACSLFEYHTKELCSLIKEEHKMPLEWDDMEGTVLAKTKRYLGFAGIVLRSDPPGSYPYSLMTGILGEKILTVKELWRELENYFMVRNCLVHQNGIIQKLRSPARIKNYVVEKKIFSEKGGQQEIFLNEKFSMEVCYTMSKFFEKLTGAYYSAPLPE